MKSADEEEANLANEEPSYDAKLLHFYIHSDKFENEAAACCSTILLRGTDNDAIFTKNSTLINGRPVFVNQFKGYEIDILKSNNSLISSANKLVNDTLT